MPYGKRARVQKDGHGEASRHTQVRTHRTLAEAGPKPVGQEASGRKEKLQAAAATSHDAPLRRRRRRQGGHDAGAPREVCPRCGSPRARLIGRNEIYPVLYLRCDDCNRTSIAPA